MNKYILFLFAFSYIIAFAQPVEIYTDLPGAISIELGDVNNDGAQDIVACGLISNKIVWIDLLNKNTAYVIDDTVRGPRDVSVVDIDNDGDVDVISAIMGENKVVYYENVDSGNKWQKHFIAKVDGASSAELISIEANGKSKIAICGIRGGLYLAVQTDDGFNTKKIGLEKHCECIEINEDNIYMSAAIQGTINYYSGALFDKKATLSSNISGASGMMIGDFNDNGISDIVVVSRFSGAIRLIESGISTLLTTVGGGCTGIVVSDLDNDGDNDLAVTLKYADYGLCLCYNAESTFKNMYYIQGGKAYSPKIYKGNIILADYNSGKILSFEGK